MKTYIFKQKPHTLTCLLFMLMEAAYIFLKAYLIQLAVETAIGNTDGALTDLIVPAIAVLAYGFLIKYLNKRLQNSLIAKLIQAMRTDIIAHILSGHKKQVDATYDTVLPAMTTELLQVEDDYIRRIFHMVQSGIIFVSITVFILTIHIWVGLIVFALSLLPLVSPIILSKRVQGKQKIYKEANAKYIDSLKDIVNGLETIKAYNVEDAVLLSVKEDISKAETAFSKMRANVYGAGVAAHGLIHFSRIAALALFGVLTLNGVVAVGILLALIEMVDTYFSRTDDIVRGMGFIKSVKPILNKLMDLATGDKEFANIEYCDIGEVSEISLDAVEFSYPDNDFTFAITQTFTRGKKYLIVGKSGSGKSTLLKLLTKDEPVSVGEIWINETPLRLINPDDWCRRMSIIGQDEYIFNASLLKNIDLADTGDLAKVELAIENASLGSWLDTLEGGLHSELGDNASLISGGEGQRIAIARALFKGSRIFLVDEATSSLDNDTALAIEHILLEKAETLIMISHRIHAKTAAMFDEILVMDNGSVIERGTFSDLMDMQSAFRDLYYFTAGKRDDD